MKKLLLATVAVLGTAGFASAADLPARMPVKAPPPVMAPAFSWTGCYIGGFVGGAWGDDATTYPVGAGYGYSYSLDSSFIGGGTLGCNWQPIGSQFVLGLEGEVGYLSLEGSAYDPVLGLVAPEYSSTKIGDWYGMITGRLGVTWDRALLYVKGGVAFVDVETAISGTLGAVSYAGTTSDTIATWTVGGGVEWAMSPNWSIKAEYMYIGLDETQTVAFPATVPSFAASYDTEFNGIHTAKVGLNYRFGGGAPLVARY
ncbi:porin family protein [Rhodoplanes sp. TEM]|uniref:Porin family protein n=1 Tax=Rhodoplanes tepidamans TaxID=200616 RepID=A0ABT5JIZ3_RHOTP|nr:MULTISPECIES: outer membrane protein [Rhodoplanes]MDC7789557.1 porin family protein [Rhodoplanes tepidamans]MDC7986732.1 porin family protein [Rhodoplanes sp. TEM]MDQ0359154.1 outer membrane immunogenic protein [Rhodoplanes tepidamans]